MTDNNNDKPFACNERGCQMKFSNVDHLSVHQKKHEMRLKLSTSSREVFAIADQTPTPSRILGNFLQNWEEVGLSHDIQEISDLTPILNDHNNKTTTNITSNANTKSSSNSDNPFVVAFKNAINSNNNNNNNCIKRVDLSSRAITDSPLNTPSIFPCNEGLLAIANAALNTPDHHFRYTESPVVAINDDKTNNAVTHLNIDNNSNNNNNNIDSTAISVDHSVSSTSQSSNSSSIETTNASVSINGISDNHISCVEPQYSTNKNVVKPQKFQAVSVICSAATNFINSTVAQTIPNIVISQPNNKLKANTKLRTVPIAQTAKNAAIIAPKSKESSITIANTNSLYKVILKLPDGRSLQLPLVQQPIAQTSSIVSSAAQPITAITNSSKTNKIIVNNETIHLANKISIGANNSISSSQYDQTSQNSSTSLSSLQSKVDATLASLPPKAKPGRKSKFAPEEDPKEKKARSLERNRAAAMRCRLKRKHWIDSLEEKADEYEKINEKLQNEVVALRREVTLLKTALLAHKDCPVTLQQQKASSESSANATNATTNGNLHNNGVNKMLDTNGVMT